MAHYWATIVILAVFAALAFAAEQADRYQRLVDHADLGCGADEFEGPRRYTRPVERQKETPERHPAKNRATGAINQTTQKQGQSHAV